MVRIAPDRGAWKEGWPDLPPGRDSSDPRRIQGEAHLRLSTLAPAGDPFPLLPGQDLPIEVRRGGDRLEFRSAGCRAEYHLKSRAGEIRVFPDRLSGSLENFLRVIYSYFLLERGGFLLHAFGFVRENSVCLLFGPSGSGKSTAAGLLPGLPPEPQPGIVLSDDTVQVSSDPRDGFLASRPPLETRFSPLPGRWPVRSAFRLIKNRRNFINPFEPATSVSHLLANVLYVSEDPETAPELLGILEKFARSCPVGELHFRPDPEFYKLIT